MVKPRLRNRLTDVTLAKLMRIVIEGPEQSSVNFEEVLEKKIIEFNFKDCLNNLLHSISFLYCFIILAAKLYCDLTFGDKLWSGGREIPGCPPPLC